MALPSSVVWEIRPSNGLDSNGGGFVPGSSGTDYSQQNSAQYTLTGGTAAGSGAVLAYAAAAADMVGNIANAVSGTNVTTGSYRVISVSVGVSITFDRNITTGVTANAAVNIGGAKQTIGAMGTILTASNQNTTGQTVWVKAESGISISAQITLSPNGGSASNAATQINGYTTTRGDNGNVTITATGGSGYTMLFMQVNGATFIRNFVLDGNSRTSIRGCALLGSNVVMENVTVQNTTNGGVQFNNQNNMAVRVTVTNNSGSECFRMDQGNGPNYAIDCQALSSSQIGFLGAQMYLLRCIAGNLTGGSTDGLQVTNNSGGVVVDGFVAYACGRDGIRFNNPTTTIVMRNVISYGNAGTDINTVATLISGSLTFDYNFYATISGVTPGAHDGTLSASPFTNGGSNDFSLNGTTGGGAVCRSAGFPGVLGAGGTGFQSPGALQPSPAGTTVNNFVPAQNIFIFDTEAE